MKRIRSAGIGVLAALTIAGSIALAMGRRSADQPSSSAPTAQEGVAPSSSAAPAAAPAPRQEFLGVVLARLIADIAPRFDGRLRDVQVRLGDRVAAGAPIAVMDVPTLRFDLQVAEATLQTSSADREQASVELAESEERLKRRKTLLAEGLVSAEDLSAAKYQQELASARVQSTRAQVSQRRAQVEKLRKDNSDMVIRAPFDGVIAARYANPGANVSPSAPIVRLISADDLFVRFAVPAAQAASLSLGARVVVRIGDHRIERRAAVDKIAPEVDSASRMVFIEAQLEKADSGNQILSGELARVSIEAAQ
jgi:RND family efflux transporter MFP subunit